MQRIETRDETGETEASNMNRDELKSLLQQSTETAERQTGCPDDYQLASYTDGGLSEEGQTRFELHLADCGYCIERVGLLGRARESEIEATVPELVLVRSRKLASCTSAEESKTGLQLRLRNAPRWVAAAVLVLAIGALSQLYSPSPNGQKPSPPIETPGQQTGLTDTRNIDPGTMGPRFLSPLEGMTITPNGGMFNWTAIPDSLYYQVRIVSDEGDLVWQERVAGTQWGLPSELSLAPGAVYFVRVDAYLAEAKTLNSDYVLFRIGDRR